MNPPTSADTEKIHAQYKALTGLGSALFLTLIYTRKTCPSCSKVKSLNHFFEITRSKCRECRIELYKKRKGASSVRQWCSKDSESYLESSRLRLLAYKSENSDTGCWEFSGRRNKDGYGTFKYIEASGLAHRASWLIFNGPIPECNYVLHRCDNRCCFNPKHLFLGTQLDNVKDCISKGRFHHQK